MSALQCATAARARQLEPRSSPFVDRDGEPAGLATAASLDPTSIGPARWVDLASGALREAVAGGRRAAPLPVILALAEAERPDQREVAGAELDLLRKIARGASVALDEARSGVVQLGHAGFAHALARATELLDEGVGVVAVGGIESPHHPEVVRWLDERGWLCKIHDDAGRIPAEAAAFLTLARRQHPRRAGVARLTAVERERSEDPRDGLLLGKLLRRVARASSAGEPAWLLTDMNGERARNEQVRQARVEAEDLFARAALDDLVQHTGDVGAASGPLFATIAVTLAKIGAVDAKNVTLALSSDTSGWSAAVGIDLPAASGGFRASRGGVAEHAARAVPGAHTATGLERAQLLRMARSCLEDVGSLGLLLAPGPVDEESRPELFGQRLLDNFDALSALAVGARGAPALRDLLEVVRAYAVEVDPPDRARRFAAAFCERHLRAPPARAQR